MEKGMDGCMHGWVGAHVKLPWSAWTAALTARAATAAYAARPGTSETAKRTRGTRPGGGGDDGGGSDAGGGAGVGAASAEPLPPSPALLQLGLLVDGGFDAARVKSPDAMKSAKSIAGRRPRTKRMDEWKSREQ
jgi:hypothetical protein